MSRIFAVIIAISLVVGAHVGAFADASPVTEVANLDLSGPFPIKTPWRFRLTQGPPKCGQALHDGCNGDDHACFVRDGGSDCSDWSGIVLDSVEIVTPGKTPDSPLLVVRTHDDASTSGAGTIATTIQTYDRRKKAFANVFYNRSSGNTNEETRVVRDGPLSGDTIVSHAPRHAPYHYGISVYRTTRDGHYVEIARVIGNTRCDDGNPMPVIDSEMLRTLERLHLWKPGDPLPVPDPARVQCQKLTLREGTEWCE
jgi:hypothetical protein